MRKFALIMFDETKRFADALGAEGEIDLPHAMNELTVKIASRCLIGQEVRDRVDTGFAEAYHELQNGINTLGFFLPRLPTAATETATGHGGKWPSSSAGSWRRAGVPGPIPTISCRRSCRPVTRTAAR